MSKRPWFPFYVGDYLANTGHLRTIDHGAYLLLIIHYCEKRGLPTDDHQLAAIARLTDREWKLVRPKLVSMFSENWRSKRIDEEIAKAEAISNKRSAAVNSRPDRSGKVIKFDGGRND